MTKTLTCPDYHWASKRWQRTEEIFEVLNEINIGNLKLNWRTLPDYSSKILSDCSGSNAQNICNCHSGLNFSYLAAHHFNPAAKRGSQSEFSLQQEEKKQIHIALYCSALWIYSIASSSGSRSIFFLQLQLLTSAFLGFQVSRKQNACEESTRIIVHIPWL